MDSCPCGSRRPEEACCGPLLAGIRDAPSPEALARARYTAYTRHHVDFLLRTYCPERQYLFDRETTLLWARRSVWESFEIRSCRALPPAAQVPTGPGAGTGGDDAAGPVGLPPAEPADEAPPAGPPPEAAAEVEFIARYRCGGRACLHHEIARFHQLHGRWYYIDGSFPDEEALLGTESRRLPREQGGAAT